MSARAAQERRSRVEIEFDPAWPDWSAGTCVRVDACDERGSAAEIAAKRLGPMGGWKTGADVDEEGYAAGEYRYHAAPGDCTRSVIVASCSA